MIETRMRENMHKADCAYIAGWNIPGHLPAMVPATFNNETDAIRYLSDTVNRFWDEDSELDKGWADEQWTDIFSNLPYETAPFNVQNGDGTLTFWVTVVPKSDLPYDSEGN